MPVACLVAARERRPDGQAEDKAIRSGAGGFCPNERYAGASARAPALPHRRRHGALNAPRLKRSRRPRGAPKAGPRWPEGAAPQPASQGREGCIEARPSRQSEIFSSAVNFAVLVRAVAANDGGLLFGRRLHVREYALGALLCERAAAWRALASCDGRRQASFSESGLARSGRPMPIRASCFRMDCRCRSIRRFRSRGFRLFRFRSAARRLWADRARVSIRAEEARAREAAAEARAAAATPIT